MPELALTPIKMTMNLGSDTMNDLAQTKVKHERERLRGGERVFEGFISSNS
jgi:hypothetical protein